MILFRGMCVLFGCFFFVCVLLCVVFFVCCLFCVVSVMCDFVLDEMGDWRDVVHTLEAKYTTTKWRDVLHTWEA